MFQKKIKNIDNFNSTSSSVSPDVSSSVSSSSPTTPSIVEEEDDEKEKRNIVAFLIFAFTTLFILFVTLKEDNALFPLVILYIFPIIACFVAIDDKTSRWITVVSIFVVEFAIVVYIRRGNYKASLKNKQINKGTDSDGFKLIGTLSENEPFNPNQKMRHQSDVSFKSVNSEA